MKDFPAWYKELCEDVRWFEYTSMHNRGKNFKTAAEFVYGQLVSDPVLERRPMTENRKHVYNKLTTMPYDKVAPTLQQVERQEVDKEWKPASPEHVDKCVAEFDEMMKNSSMINGMPRLSTKEILQNGEWKPARLEPRSDIQKVMVVEDYISKIRTARAKVFKNYYPDASDEEVEAYCNKFSDV